MDSDPSEKSTCAHQIAEIRTAVAQIGIEHFKLIFIVGGGLAGRSKILHQFAELEGLALVNVGKSLSEALLEISPPYRPASAEEIFQTLIEVNQSGPVCLDRIEILFEDSLCLNPIELLKNTSRHQVLIVSWPGTCDCDHLFFGPQDHPSSRKVSVDQVEFRLLELLS